MDTENNNTEISNLKNNLLKLNCLFLFFLGVFAVIAIFLMNRETALTNKVVELSQKANVEVVAKTNTLFGVWTKVHLVK